ncbi:putative F-box protein [Ananas comosus]|uniref:Putative F-box protein n=1 Tax=Ananas comosus TaxID=4615 RepID=A0A199UYC2_ANACO|nr:putative F-box protein [Ananas comosus]
MATLQAQSLLLSVSSSSPSSSSYSFRQRCRAVLHASLSNLSPKGNIPPIAIRLTEVDDHRRVITPAGFTPLLPPKSPQAKIDDAVIRKLYAIAEAAADRAEMHAIIGKQRDNWNHLFLHSVNSLALSASLMSGLACVGSDASSPHVLAFKLSSVLLFAATSTVMLVVNKVQPSQLAEEQRNAARLWRKLEKEIQSKLSLQTPRESDVDASMRKVLALDKAYPLPLLPGMLEKFPKKVEPTCWWPRKEYKQSETTAIDEKYQTNYSNGWSKELEESMKGVAKVLQTKDQAEYVTVGKLVLNINKGFAIAGPVFAGMAAAAAGFIGLPATGSWPVLVTAVGGALAATVNTLEHGGQVGMVFELARNCAGFYKKLEEEIEESLEEREAEKRENGELFELKMALSLGRSVSDLRKFRSFASASGKVDEDVTEFAGKLF